MYNWNEKQQLQSYRILLVYFSMHIHTHTHTHRVEVSFRLPGGSGGYPGGTSGKEPAC